MSDKTGTAYIHVYGTVPGLRIALAGAEVKVYEVVRASEGSQKARARTRDASGVRLSAEPHVGTTGPDGSCSFHLPEGQYTAHATFPGHAERLDKQDKLDRSDDFEMFHVCDADTVDATVEIDLSRLVQVSSSSNDQHYTKFSEFDLKYKKPTFLKFIWPDEWTSIKMAIGATGAIVNLVRTGSAVFYILPNGKNTQLAIAMASGGVTPLPETKDGVIIPVTPPEISAVEGDLSIALKRTASRETGDLALWAVIRRATNALAFDRYADFMNWIFCGEGPRPPQADRLPFVDGRRFLPFSDTDAYRNVKAATEAFVMANCGIVNKFQEDEASYIADYVSIGSNFDLNQLLNDHLVGRQPEKVLPYLAVIRAKLADERIKNTDMGKIDLASPLTSPESCYGILKDRLQAPCLLELIWSYWQEEGMLVQTMNAVTRRFQNMRSPGANDPLANLEIDPLRSLNNLLWGTIQDEQHRLSVVRRNYEYDHHYGLRLAGRAVDGTRPADSRSKFLEAFHALLSIVGAFYKRDDDTTMVADGFPVLNALKEAHLILSQGAHNQFGDLPSTARIEMLMQQWILARPEFREFIPTRIMVAYPEPWMDRVDAMKKLQNWTDTSVLHFRNLAIFGEQILLGIRYGNWNAVFESFQAVNWARYWRPQIQGYMHAYRAVTGVDLSVDVTNASIDAMMPSVHLVRRLAAQQRAS